MNQMVPSRLDKILDLFLTSQQNIVQNMHTHILPGNSDHDIFITVCDINLRLKKQSRKILNLKTTNW